MRDLPIAYGNSCYAKTWANKTTAWEDLCERLKNTIRTTETVEEYPKLKKDDRDRAKDKGGFVGGYLKGNRRKRETVVCRSMLTMDADHAEIGFIDRFASECRYASCLYTTHGHTPEQPRCRIIVPLTRDITPDEYVALARYFAADWGIDQFDECSYKPSQLMYWPTTPANGEFICETTEGEWLDPDVYLSAHPNWKDCSLLPTSSRESAVREASGKKQEDPLAKPGVVGAFCRAYGIAAVIETYLADVYEPSAMEGRYDYIPADSSAGVVIYDDKFAYSHHATDPACGKLLNAFDLVRIHRFGDDDEKKSFKQMTELALADDAVKENLAAERIAQAGEDFSDDADWHKRLHFIPRSGALENSVWNLNLILENDPDLQGFAFNDMANRIQVTGELPWERPEGNDEEWLKWTIRAFQATYGYEFQGDNLLIARVNLVMTFEEYFEERMKRKPDLREYGKIITIVAWNIWQMDGLTGTIPYHEVREVEQVSLFDLFDFDVSDKQKENKQSPCKIYDWRKDNALTYISLRRNVCCSD